MQFKPKHGYITLGCTTLLSGIVLLINVMAQAPEKAQIAFSSNRDGNFYHSANAEDYLPQDTRQICPIP
jgi:hypothetical protein